MATTRARRARRAKMNLVSTAIDTMLDAYKQSPNEALKLCHEWFGREQFTRTLRPLIHRNRAKQAFILAVEQSMAQKLLAEETAKIRVEVASRLEGMLVDRIVGIQEAA